MDSFKFIMALLFFAVLLFGCNKPNQNAPGYLLGSFEDDYSIQYELNDKVFLQKPSTRFHILKWNIEDQYFIAKNDSLNPYDPKLYTRIDWVTFNNMSPFLWGFCLTTYNALTADSAENIDTVDRENPKTGCNGYPFSRMKPIET
ncbi:MAG TPA: hypothetical protein DCL80_15720 [Balneola sp.]|nr:hypothetical protein [Balneola sp.]MAO79040.1 hypothetical protein [Balneola sp.]MBF63699.1 hypothetical protein [Balneola sp.]HAH52620.1 hypothetical protein [Balneola sp.]HAW81202.1 hypothetical protein [Balneola sp.]|tara:strand:+ start:17236 stop:17670 length:435 start_codon:yes stop_codon:yes gene_type:complete